MEGTPPSEFDDVTRKLARLGYRVVRIDADLVMRALPEALAQVRDALRGRARATGCSFAPKTQRFRDF